MLFILRETGRRKLNELYQKVTCVCHSLFYIMGAYLWHCLGTVQDFHATFDIRFVSGVWLILALFDKFVRLGQEPLEVREHEQL